MSNTDNFDAPEDMDQPLDQDMDFDSFEDNKDKSLGSTWQKSPLLKIGVVALVIIIVIGLISLFGGEKIDAPQSVVSKGAGSTFKEAPGLKEVSPVMKDALEERNKQRVDEAQRTGTSVIPTPITPPKALLDVPQGDVQSEDPLLRWQQMQTERAKAQREQQIMQEQQVQEDPQKEARINEMVTAMTQQIGPILGKDNVKQLQSMKVYDPSKLTGTIDANGNPIVVAASTGVNGNVAIVEPQTPPKIIVPAGKIEYAQMVLEANSDVPGPVVALVASGQFNGAKLLGKFTTQDEYLVITFSTLVTKKGTSIPINAYAIDPATSLTGVATDVDQRYFKRIILPAAAKFVEGLGDAYAQSASETTQNASSTTTSTSDLNTKQEFGNAVSEAAKSIGEILTEDGSNTKPLVIVAAGTPLGILFMESITDKAVLQARIGGVGQQQAVQPQAPSNQYLMQNPQQAGFLNQLQQLQYGLQGQQLMQQNGSVYGNTPENNTQQ